MGWWIIEGVWTSDARGGKSQRRVEHGTRGICKKKDLHLDGPDRCRRVSLLYPVPLSFTPVCSAVLSPGAKP